MGLKTKNDIASLSDVDLLNYGLSNENTINLFRKFLRLYKDVLEKTALAISTYKLPFIVPLTKEIRTHIAVAKAFTQK